MNRKPNFANIIFSVLIGVTLILTAINPISASASAPAAFRTPIPTATQVITATPITTITPPSTDPALSLLSDPTYIASGGQVTISYQILNFEYIKGQAVLRFYAPTGLAPADTSIGKYDAETGIYELEVNEAEGKILWQADATIIPPVILSTELLQDGQAISKAEVTLDEMTEYTIKPEGGEADGLHGRVQVTFPAGAVVETVRVKITRPSVEALPVQSLSGAPFEITAVSDSTRAEVSRFSAPVQIVVSYSEAGMTNEASTVLYWYDPADKQWKTPLSQRLDTENNLIYATTDHFTVFDTYTSSWETAETPTMSYFQTPGFTGAASFSMPIKVPAGPGGFQPSLTLSYSSSTADSISSESQASWVGMGWSLTTSYVERNHETYSLNLNGSSMTLYQGLDGEYHASDENFYRFKLNETTEEWTVWDKTGTQYFFDHRTDMVDGCVLDTKMWRMSLGHVRNIYGQEMIYTYADETKDFYDSNCGGGGGNHKISPTWSYPEYITYANGKYRIYFDRLTENETGHRTDLKTIWSAPLTHQAYQRSLLEAIQIQHWNGGGWEIVREYKFTYNVAAPCKIFPNLIWDAGGCTPTLLSVQEYGLGGVQGGQSLPPYNFDYADKMHLTSASNGYGGTITYIYNDQTNYTQVPHDAWHDTEGGNPKRYNFAGSDDFDHWTGQIYPNGGNKALLTGTATEPTVESYQPGRWYRAVALVKPYGTSASMAFGFDYKENFTTYTNPYNPTINLNNWWTVVESEPFFLPVTATRIIPKMKKVSGSVLVDWYYLVPLPTYSRVTSRTLSSGVENYTFEYEYIGAATNNPTISVAAAGEHPKDKPYTEFRGHSQVTERDPYGNETVTVYNQDDVTTGRAASVTIWDHSSGVLKELQVTTTSYLSTSWPVEELIDHDEDPENEYYLQPFDTLYYRFVWTEEEKKIIYKTDGTAESDTLTTNYDYDLYGNQTSKTQIGGGVTLVTLTDYVTPNTSAWLVGLPARTRVMDGTNTLTESFTLYDGHNAFDTMPTVGIPTATRTWISGTQYSQTSMTHDHWGNVDSQTTWSGYGTASTAPTSGARTSYTCYGGTEGTGEYLGGKWCPNDGYHTYALWTKNALGHASEVTYDYAKGLPLSETDPNGAETSVTYDVFGRFTSLTKPDDSAPTLTVSYLVSPFRVILNQVIDATHTFTVTRYYDGLGRQYLTDTNGNLVDSTFDAFSRTIRQSTPHTGSETVYYADTTYDALGRVLTVSDFHLSGASAPILTNTDYDGLTTKVTDAKGHFTVTETDILGRTLSITPPATYDNSTPPVTFTYDALGNMKTATRGGATVALDYDNAGRKIGMDDPDLGMDGSPTDDNWGWTYEYDALGNMLHQTDARDCLMTITYDDLNRPLTKTYSGSDSGCSAPAVTYTYDIGTSNAIGRRVSMGVSGGDYTNWTYNIKGQATSENKLIPGGGMFSTGFHYNLAGLPDVMTYPDNEPITFGYNNNMSVEKVYNDNGTPGNLTDDINYAKSIAYDSAQRIKQIMRGSDVINTVFTYNAWNVDGGRLQNTTSTQVSTGTPLQNNTYDYDSVGNINTIVDSLVGQTQTFQYDELDRLVSSAVTGGSNGIYAEGYGYQPGTGNLGSKNNQTYNYDATHKHAVASVGNNTYGYDPNGNMISRNVNGQSFTLNYDAENRLVSVTGASTANFYYDADGKQVKAVVDGGTTFYIGNHYELKNSVVTKYYFAGTTRLAVRTGGTLSFLLGDHIGSSSVTTDANGVKTASALYKAFGETRYTLGNLGTDYKFTGQREEANLGIYFFNARWFDPSLGRFTSPDSIVPTSTQGTQAWDRYAFVNNNPVRFNDPTGHQAEADSDRSHEDDNVNGSSSTSSAPTENNPAGTPPCSAVFSDQQCQLLSTALSLSVLTLDSTSLSLSAVGVILETVGWFTGGPEGLAAAIGLYQPYNTTENTLAWYSLGTSAINDAFITGESYGTLDGNWHGIPSAEIVLGSDTTVGLAVAIAGLSPEGFTDFGINSIAVAYDFYRLGGGDPILQTHIGITYTLHPYISLSQP